MAFALYASSKNGARIRRQDYRLALGLLGEGPTTLVTDKRSKGEELEITGCWQNSYGINYQSFKNESRINRLRALETNVLFENWFLKWRKYSQKETAELQQRHFFALLNYFMLLLHGPADRPTGRGFVGYVSTELRRFKELPAANTLLTCFGGSEQYHRPRRFLLHLQSHHPPNEIHLETMP